jgi:hypothetical protein
MQVVFSRPELRRYVGVRGGPVPLTKEAASLSNLLATRGELEPQTLGGSRGVVPPAQQSPGGWRHHPERRSRTGTDVMRNHASGDERMHQ